MCPRSSLPFFRLVERFFGVVVGGVTGSSFTFTAARAGDGDDLALAAGLGEVRRSVLVFGVVVFCAAGSRCVFATVVCASLVLTESMAK